MSEVKRISVFIHGPNKAIDMVEAVHLDRVTAERDAALSKLEESQVDCEANKHEREVVCANYEVLQQRLTAAGERNDQRDTEIAAQVESALRRSFSLGQIYWQQADSDSTRQQNKSDQTMEVQQQHILNVLKSISAALNPGADRPGYVQAPPGTVEIGTHRDNDGLDEMRKPAMCDCNQGRLPCTCKPSAYDGFDNGVD